MSSTKSDICRANSFSVPLTHVSIGLSDFRNVDSSTLGLIISSGVTRSQLPSNTTAIMMGMYFGFIIFVIKPLLMHILKTAY